jgi:hypothetical protein
MKRLGIGFFVVLLLALFFFWRIMHLAFVFIRLAFSMAAFLFCCYLLYVFWGAIVQIFKGRNR